MSVLSTTSQEDLEKMLLQQQVVAAEELIKIKESIQGTDDTIISYLLKNGHLTSESLARILAGHVGTPYVNLSNAQISQKMLELLPTEVAERYMAVPIGEIDGNVAVAMIDPDNVQAADFIGSKIGRPLKVFMASEEGIRRVLKQYSTNLKQGVENVLAESGEVAAVRAVEGEEEKANTQLKDQVKDSPISRALNTILEYAAKANASDIHMEPLERSFKIRCRVDGVLREIMQLPKTIEPALVSRIKILSDLKIDEHRIPQDGQFAVRVGGREIDLRIAISPVLWGEQVVIRLLDKSGVNFNLEEMGYTGRNLRAIKEGISKPYGMIITSGPTGSGKSTSLYALLQTIKDDAINIVTLEDPVEYKMQGINQIQVNPEVGLTFASGLRSILRQDPDVVMVGEIRDKETATLAVQAALTGHLVFSTLHTNSAGGVLPRLLDMGIEPFLIASTINTVIGQRLVRRVAPNNETYASDPAESESIQEVLGDLLPKTENERAQKALDLGYSDLPLVGQKAYTLVRGKDSHDAPGGYKGRLGIYEVFSMSEEIEALILERAPSSQIEEAAQAQGMITMRQDGYLKALAGKTTLKEVNRVAAETI